MSPMPVTFYVYADDDQQIRRLQEALYEFVKGNYDKGNLITADKLNRVIKTVENNPLAQTFLR